MPRISRSPRDNRLCRPACMQDAVEACVLHAQRTKRMSVDMIADLVGESRWTVYKWIQTGNVPSRKIPGFEHACGAHYVTHYLAAAARKVVIDIPTGRLAGASDVHAVQDACTAAIGALIAFGQRKADAQQTLDAITVAIERLAFERENVSRNDQPELPLS